MIFSYPRGDHPAPYVLVRDPLPATVAPAPKLKIFGAVIMTNAVLVVDSLMLKQFAPKYLLHNEAMFWLLITVVLLAVGQ